MALFAKVFSVLVSLAALLTSVEAIVRLTRFAWSLLLRLLSLGKGRAVFFRPGFARA